MGGAVAARCAAQLHETLETIVGLIVIDVVEGTAMDALQSMYCVLSSRPKSFPSLKNAIEWRWVMFLYLLKSYFKEFEFRTLT